MCTDFSMDICFTSPRCVHTRGIAGPCGKPMLTFSRNYKLLFKQAASLYTPAALWGFQCLQPSPVLLLTTHHLLQPTRRLWFTVLQWWVTLAPFHVLTDPSNIFFGLPWWLCGKELPANAGNLGSVPVLGRSAGAGNGNPLQYPYLEDSTDRGVWRAMVHGAAKESFKI